MTTFSAALIALLAAMGSGWALRQLILGRLRGSHAQVFEALGRPSDRQLQSLLPKNTETQLKFWKFLWNGRAFSLGDRYLAILAGGVLAADVVLVASAALLFWSAATGAAVASAS